MKSTRDLVNKIEKNSLNAIEIDNEIACSSEIIDALDVRGHKLYNYMGDNKVIIFDNKGESKTDVMILDLASKKIVSKQQVNFPDPSGGNYFLTSSIVLDDKNYIAIGDGYGKLLILNVQNMQIVASHEIGYYSHSLTGYPSVSLYKNADKLYGLGGHYPNINFFVASSTTPTLQPKISRLGHSYSSGDIALDRTGQLFLPYAHCASLSGDSLGSVYDHARAYLNCGNKMRLIQKPTGDSYLVSSDNDGYGAFIFYSKEEASHRSVYLSSLHGKINFKKEQLRGIEVLSEESKQILFITDKASYIYDLTIDAIIGKIKVRSPYHIHCISDNVLLVNSPYYPDKADNCAIETFYNMKEKSELTMVLDALKENKSVTYVTISGKVQNALALQSLSNLKKTRPELKLEISDDIQLELKQVVEERLTAKSQLDAMKIEKDAKEVAIAKFKFELAEKTTEKLQLNSKLSLFKKKNKHLKKQIAEQTELINSKIKDIESQLQIQQKSFTELKKEFIVKEKNYHEALDEAKGKSNQLQSKLSTLSKGYEDALIRLSTPPIPSIPLIDQLDEAKELTDELLLQLVEPTQDIQGLSLIRWSENSELENIKDNLLERGAILTVDDLLDRINKIKPPYNEKHKVEYLTSAVVKLMQDYDDLPPSAMKSLTDLIAPEIEQDIKHGETKWLKKSYSTKIYEIQKNIKSEYFLRKPSVAVPSLDTQFKQAINDILSNEEYEIYHEYLTDTGILDKIRKGDKDDISFNQLVDIIKDKINSIKIELNAGHHQEAILAILKKPTPEMNKLIRAKIIQYGEKLKQALDPKMAEIRLLKAQILELQRQLESMPPQPRPENPRVTTIPATLFASAHAQSQDQQQSEVVVFSLPKGRAVSGH